MERGVRYHEIDWLRTLLIIGVFLHHAFMPFNGDDWHIMNAQSSKLLDDIMVYFEQMRLPALFFIAGAGAFILLGRLSAVAFLKDKARRLLLPLIVGVLFIVPPQRYFENRSEYGSYLDAYPELVSHLSTNHLWFIEYLLILMVMAVPLFALAGQGPLSRLGTQLQSLLSARFAAVVVAVLIGGFNVLLHHNKGGEDLSYSADLTFYAVFFGLGMLSISSASTWRSFAAHRRFNLIAFIIISGLFYAYYLVDFSGVFSLPTRWSLWWFFCAVLSWSSVSVMLGYAQQYLRFQSSTLRWCNQFIYPFYIFHQTVIIILGYFILATDASLFVKATLLAAGSFTATVLICAIGIAPFNPVRVLFGVRPRSS
ncbi:acyltransferase family protein [Alteromonas oceanisediminis]|uniref:acyltransferase family protein n=1 Tax=Alteromonas oceanisediminis TaxID=2836180 RepID=UPI001BDA9473|nr:acyltransferase [Alteromonas oceanisediminis]MBT0586627.1 acyltransferase [Alteromonas oceanisediminis]